MKELKKKLAQKKQLDMTITMRILQECINNSYTRFLMQLLGTPLPQPMESYPSSIDTQAT